MVKKGTIKKTKKINYEEYVRRVRTMKRMPKSGKK